MKRALAWLAGALGLAALLRRQRREHAVPPPVAPPAPAPDPAAELRQKLEQARAADDRDEFDAAEGQPVDEVDRVSQPEPDEEPAEEPAEEPVEQATPVEEPAEEPAAETEELEEPRSLEERRRAIHEKAQEALGAMQRPDPDA